ncbi:MAG: deoxyribodipyrimidine photo-lyase [Waddliaceae bacterium]
MSQKIKRALFIFRRDLRLEDNTGLNFALENADEVIVCFIFTPEQIDSNPYRGDHCLQFMIESLEELQEDIASKGGRLYLFYGKPKEVVTQLIQTQHIESVVVNRDYTPYSIKRDKSIEETCREFAISFHAFDDLLLQPPEQALKRDGTPYQVFTPFYRNAMQLRVDLPTSNQHKNYYSGSIEFAKDNSIFKKILPKRLLPRSGGRRNALKILKDIKRFSYYETFRDFPANDSTTHLSAHLKFTTCSVREVYLSISREFGASSSLIRSLYWRDFFSSIALYFPKVFTGAFHSKYNQLEWSSNEETFQSWCEGRTGFPLIDAGMREMNKTGYMHNRVRMLAASFLVKDLHINWQWGERYFAKRLIDYDPAVNNGNWQWASSTGCDAQPYFRIFNPWTQSTKFDPDCLYIKKWVPELKVLPPKAIHKWYEEKNHVLAPDYPPPIVDHATESKIALSLYKKVR